MNFDPEFRMEFQNYASRKYCVTFNFDQIRGQKKSTWYMNLPTKFIITAKSIILS